MSLSYGHSLAITGTFIFVSIVVVSAHFTNFNLFGIERPQGTGPKEVGLYSEEDLIIGFVNQWARPRPDIEIEIQIGGMTLHQIGSFDSKSSSSLHFDTTHLKRGNYRIEKIKLSTVFPFGLFRSWKYLKSDALQVWVYPKPIKPDGPLSRSTSQATHSKHTKAELKNSSENGAENFYEHAPYRDGVGLKRIDWKVYSKTHELFEKRYQDLEAKEFIVDQNFFLHLPLELQLSYLCYLVLEYSHKGHRFAFILHGQAAIWGEGKKFERKCLMALAEYR